MFKIKKPAMSKLLTSSSRFAPDSGEILLKAFENIQKETTEKKLKSEVARLTHLRDSLKRRRDILTEEINSKKPRTFSDINEEAQFVSRKVESMDISEFLNDQKLQVFQFAFDTHISSRTNSKITFEFGQEYSVTMCKSNPGFALDSAMLPAPFSLEPKFYNFSKKSRENPVIPIQELATEFLPKIDKFVSQLKQFIDAYVSRFRQLEDINRVFEKNPVDDIEYNADFTRIKLQMTMEDEENSNIILNLMLKYEHGEDRPKAEGMRMKLAGKGRDNLDEEAMADLKNQCNLFYSLSICEAIQQSFA